uniref:Uncharacterized protein n=1 Tax=Arundo donax TaxID=35708 RepID=A0A0A9CL41_ARUDO
MASLPTKEEIKTSPDELILHPCPVRGQERRVKTTGERREAPRRRQDAWIWTDASSARRAVEGMAAAGLGWWVANQTQEMARTPIQALVPTNLSKSHRVLAPPTQ